MDSDQKSKTERKIAIDLENNLILLNRYVELLPGMKYMIVDTAKLSWSSYSFSDSISDHKKVLSSFEYKVPQRDRHSDY